MQEKFASVGTFMCLGILAGLLALLVLVVDPIQPVLAAYLAVLSPWLIEHKVGVSEYISLLGAVGTVGAVVAALKLARRDRDQALADSEARARLAAASVSARLSLTSERIRSLVPTAIFLNLDLPEASARIQAIDRVRRELKRIKFRPDDRTLLALTPLPNNCAHRIARAFDYIESLRRETDALPVGLMSETMSGAEVSATLERFSGYLLAASDLLNVAIDECAKASDIGAPMPSGQELFGEPTDMGEGD